ncbi:MAG: hypothetical protein ACT4P7_00930 [Gemmatimonadaceae bacterium]
MSINGIRGPYGNVPARPAAPARPEQAPVGGARPGQIARQQPSAPGAAPVAGAPVSVQPPAGTDPELWTVLTQDERAYFAKLGAMGPLTYGRVLSGQMQPPAPSVRGGRLDVKA